MSRPRPAQPLAHCPNGEQADRGVLTADDVERVARRTIELMREEAAPPILVDAAELARLLATSRSWIYAHADLLGAVRLGEGPRAGLRFDPAEAARRLGARQAGERSQGPPERIPEPKSQGRSARRRQAGARLLPIRGDGGAP